MKLLLKLGLAALVASASWRLGSEYVTHYRFREAVREATAEHRSEEELRRVILEQAAKFSVPLAEDALTIRVDERHVVVSGDYVRPIELLPGYEHPWRFDWTVETFPPVNQPAPAPR